MATIQDVAKAAGVSRSTVSGAFSGKARMTSERRAHILEVARELRYEPNLLAQRLGRRGGHEVISVLAPPDFGQETRTFQFLVHRLEELGFEVDCSAPPYYGPDAEERQVALFNRVRRLGPRAIVVSLAHNASPRLLNELRRYVEDGGVTVCYSYGDLTAALSFADCVAFDRYQSTYDAVQFLLEQGHRKIGYNSHGPADPNEARMRALRDAHEQWGLQVNPNWVWNFWNYELGGMQLAQSFLSCAERPTALQVVNDYSASAFVNALFRAGVRVPDDVSVIGNEDAPAAISALVPLTTVAVPFEAMATQVIQLLQSRLDGSFAGAPRLRRVCGSLVHRESVAKQTN